MALLRAFLPMEQIQGHLPRSRDSHRRVRRILRVRALFHEGCPQARTPQHRAVKGDRLEEWDRSGDLYGQRRRG